MWQAEIKSIQSDIPGVIQVEFEYTHTDGRKKNVTERISEPESIKKIAQDAVRNLKRIDDLDALVANPTLGTVDFSTPTPTPEQVSKQAYEIQRQELVALKQDFDLGLADKATYDAKVAAVKLIKP